MKRTKNIIWGIALIAIGVIWGLNSLEIIKFTLFFDGWWTLFIIIPSLIDIFTEREKTGGIIGLGIGIMMLLACLNILDFGSLWKLILPFIAIVIGVRLLFEKSDGSQSMIINYSKNKKEYTAIFSGQELNLQNEVFDGAKLTSIFGGIEFNLRNAIIEKDVVIETVSIFGGNDILLPDNVNVKTEAVSIFGGIDCKKRVAENSSFPTVYIKSTDIFGGTDIK